MNVKRIKILRALMALSLCILLIPAAWAAPTDTLEAAGDCRREAGIYLPREEAVTEVFSEGLCAVKLGGKWGYTDREGLLVIEPVYDAAGAFHEETAWAELDGRRILIDREGREILDVSAYDAVIGPENGRLRVKQGGKWGLIDLTGSVLIEPVYDTLEAKSGEVLCASKDGKYGYINDKGAVVIAFEWDYAESFSEGVGYVEKDGCGSLIDLRGVILADNMYTGISDGLALTMENGLWGFADSQGEIVIPCTFSDAEAPDDGMIRVSNEGLWGFADLSGTVVIEPAWGYVWPFSEGCALYAAFDESGTGIVGYGFIDRLGNTVTPPVYMQARHFSEGYAAVYDGEKWGYIDQTGALVLPCVYDYASDFSEGYAACAVGDVYRIIDHEGTALTVYREGEKPEPVPEEPEQTVETEQKSGETNAAALIVIIIAAALVLFIAGVSILRGMNIRRRRRARKARQQMNFLMDEDEKNERN